MGTHSICFLGEIRNYQQFLVEKKKSDLPGAIDIFSYFSPKTCSGKKWFWGEVRKSVKWLPLLS